MSLAYDSIAAAWWPYLFILIAGSLATDVWRWIGVFAGSRLSEESELLVWVRAVATALVGGVVGQLLLFPTGALAAAPVWLRILAAALGFAAFWSWRKSILVGVLVGEAALVGGWLVLG